MKLSSNIKLILRWTIMFWRMINIRQNDETVL